MENKEEDLLERILHERKNWMNLIVIGINLLLFLLLEITGSSENVGHLVKWGAQSRDLVAQGEYYRLVSSMFLHAGFEHLLGNMLLLFFIGDYLERFVGHFRYLGIYFGGGVAANLLSYAVACRVRSTAVSVGASGAIYAVLGGLIALLILHHGKLQELSLPRVLLMAAMLVYYSVRSTGVDNAAHLGGLFSGILITFLVYSRNSDRYRKNCINEPEDLR